MKYYAILCLYCGEDAQIHPTLFEDKEKAEEIRAEIASSSETLIAEIQEVYTK